MTGGRTPPRRHPLQNSFGVRREPQGLDLLIRRPLLHVRHRCPGVGTWRRPAFPNRGEFDGLFGRPEEKARTGERMVHRGARSAHSSSEPIVQLRSA
jgi:hypothetical protein